MHDYLLVIQNYSPMTTDDIMVQYFVPAGIRMVVLGIVIGTIAWLMVKKRKPLLPAKLRQYGTWVFIAACLAALPHILWVLSPLGTLALAWFIPNRASVE